jgi:hypothetical protein
MLDSQVREMRQKRTLIFYGSRITSNIIASPALGYFLAEIQNKMAIAGKNKERMITVLLFKNPPFVT